jgi:CubicO group peptidase (beta-lactamase class C family)
VSRSICIRRAAALLGVIALAGAACSSGSSPEADPVATPSEAGGSDDVVYPGAEWARGDPANAGFDPARLEQIATEAERNDSDCLVVARHGRIVAEWYWNDTDASTVQEAFSATKSFTSTLVGIAQEDGDLDISDPASEHIPEWADGPAAAVTVEDLLSNDSGRFWDLETDYGSLITASDRTAFATGLEQTDEPGEVWVYNNAAIQTLEAVLSEATGTGPADYAENRLFDPIGMASTEMSRDNAGNANVFFGLQTTCEDLARFGYLFLNRGEWDGTQVVPEDWVEAATGRPSQDLNASYGYLWWLNHPGPAANPVQPLTREQADAAPDEQIADGAPEDMYWALGLGGQVVQVDPGSGTVVVRMGSGDPTATYGAAETSRVVTEALVEG